MPKVPFPLQPVLTYRENVVDLLERQLAQLLAQRHALQQQLRALTAQQREIAACLVRQQMGRVHLERLRLYLAYRDWLQECEQELLRRLARLEEQIEAKREELLTALQDQEVLEKLKERMVARWLAEQERQEADLHDEMATTQFIRAKAEARS